MNEFLLLAMAILNVGFILASLNLGKEHLYTAIIIFLALIPTVGGKIVEFWGFETNTGNIFYASVFLSTYFLTERFGKREGMRSIWVGVIGVIFFGALINIAVMFTGSPITASLNDALDITFSPSMRIAVASIFSYVFSQSLNIHIYVLLKKRLFNAKLWFRANIANAIAQTFDSLLFFTIAFWGIIPPSNISEIMLTGLVIKIVFMMLASPVLYMNRVEFGDDGFSTVVSR